MKRHVICLGDSNTHGYCGAQEGETLCGGRFSEAERWPCLLQRALGEEYLVIEEGLCGRTTVFPDPLEPGLDAISYLRPCLLSHAPVSLLILMLGTNDTKERFGLSAEEIARGMERLARQAMSEDCWGPVGPDLLVTSFQVTLRHLPQTLLLILLLFVTVWATAGFFPLAVFTPALNALLASMPAERVIRRYLPEKEPEGEEL